MSGDRDDDAGRVGAEEADSTESARVVVAVMATAGEVEFAQRVLDAAEIASWPEPCDNERGLGWSISVSKSRAAAARRRLSMVPDVG